MLKSLTLILLCQLLGEIITRTTQLLVPGPVFGMLILFCGLLWFKGVPESLSNTAGTLLHYLPMLFVPAGVGIIVNFALISRAWLPITAALLLGTTFTIVITALFMQLTLSLGHKKKSGDSDE